LFVYDLEKIEQKGTSIHMRNSKPEGRKIDLLCSIID